MVNKTAKYKNSFITNKNVSRKGQCVCVLIDLCDSSSSLPSSDWIVSTFKQSEQDDIGDDDGGVWQPKGATK